MCGIVGLFNCGDELALAEMAQAIAHRGPDSTGLQWFPARNSGIAHQRLSILDLSSAGHQPMPNENEELWITYNGEIYNFKAIRSELIAKGHHFHSQTDTEVLLHAYEEWGPECLQRLNGMFAFAIYDHKKDKLFAARDRLGIKPLYYHSKKDSLIVSSEIKAILASGLVPARPDMFALQTPTSFQVTPYTGFQEILKLPAGHYLLMENGQLNTVQYWDIHPTEDSLTETAALEQLEELLQSSVELQMIADVPVGLFLSGGLDSSIIAALMRTQTSQNIHSFTIRFSGADQKFEQNTDDSVFANEVAKSFGFRHREIVVEPNIEDLLPKMVWHLDEPLADPAAINTFLISKEARELGIIVLLNGMGGDEIFGGYRKQLACLLADRYNHYVPKFAQDGLSAAFDLVPVATSSRGLRRLRWAKRFFSFASLPRAERFLSSDLSLSPSQYEKFFSNGVSYSSSHFFKAQENRFQPKELSYLTQMCLNDTKVMLPEHNLLYSDKSTMAASIESRPPLTDHRIAEFMFSLSPGFRINGRTQKYLLKKVSEKYLSKSVIYRPKAPFSSPLRSWIRGPLSEMVNDLLSENAVRKRGLYNYEYISQLIENDRNGLEDNAHIIWGLLTKEIWFQTFFD